MRILVTNDDGVYAPGIAVLARDLVADGHEVTVAAPLEDTSGSGTGTGPQRRDEIDRFTCIRTEVAGIMAFGIAGLPALCVTAGCAGAFGPPPEVVVSGVNAGRNVGRSVLHSGTVGAALTAAQLGFPAIAASVQVMRNQLPHFETASWLACRLVPLAAAVASSSVLNCNAPSRELAELAGIRLSSLGNAELVRSARVHEELLEIEFLRAVQPGAEDTDEVLTDAGYATVTVLEAACPASGRSRANIAAALLGLEAALETERQQ